MKKLALAVQAALFSASALAAGTHPVANYDQFLTQHAELAKQQQSPTKAQYKTQLLQNQQQALQGYKGQTDALLGAATFVFASPAEQQASVSGNVARQGIQSNLAAPAPAQKVVSVLEPKLAADAQARQFLRGKTGTMSLDIDSIDTAKLHEYHDTGKGPVIIRYKQHINGIEVYGRQVAVVLNRQLQPVAASGYFAKVPTSQSSSVYTSSALSPTNQLQNNTTLTAQKALSLAWQDAGGALDSSAFVSDGSNNVFQSFTVSGKQASELKARSGQHVRKIWYPKADGSLALAYQVIISGESADGANQIGYGYIIDAKDGSVLVRNNLVANHSHGDTFTYKVYANEQGPLDGPLGNDIQPVSSGPTGPFPRVGAAMSEVNLMHGPISTQDPWLVKGATETKGNNVDAYADLDGFTDAEGYDGPNDGFTEGGTDFRAQTNGSNSFVYDHVVDADPDTDQARHSAIVNLFYLNNWLHDYWYDHGFDETAGNAQADNYERGGVAGDVLLAEAQDASGQNNANMLTPPDGISPRMQMYIFSAPVVGEVSFDGIGSTEFTVANFGPQNFDLTGDVVFFINNADEDDDDAPGDACVEVEEPELYQDKVVMLWRGSCDFTTKVANMQDAGAKGVIIMNSFGPLVSMSGENPDITIPVVLIQMDLEAKVRLQLIRGNTVTATLKRTATDNRDGTFDNAIIAHEFFHYVSGRLVGDGMGLSNEQGRGLGEGWSDFASMLLLVRPEDKLLAFNNQYQGPYGTVSYVDDNQYFGIRRYPYSTNLLINPLTFRYLESGINLPQGIPVNTSLDGANNPEVHAMGEIWANTLWEVYAALLNDGRYSFQQAQERMKDYVIAGLKLTPAQPTFLEARDALLAAAAATDAQDFKLMAYAFAKRGMGMGAVAAPRESVYMEGVSESFTALAGNLAVETARLSFTYEDGTQGWIDNDGVLDPGETAELTVTLRNTGTEDVTTAFKAKFSSEADVSYPQGDEINFEPVAMGDTVTATLLVKLESAVKAGEAMQVSIEFPQTDDTNPNAVIEPEVQTGVFFVNYDLLNNQRSMENLDNPATLAYDWSTELTGGVGSAAAPNAYFNWGADSSADSIFGTGTLWWGLAADSFSSSSLITPEVTVTEDTFALNFEHWYSFQWISADGMVYDDEGNPLVAGVDAGVIEISIDGAEWQDVTAAGGEFEQGGYNGVAYSLTDMNGVPPFDTWPAGFVNDASFDLILQPVRLSFGNQLQGKKVQLRFRISTNFSVGSPGWLIDHISFDGVAEKPFSSVITEDGVADNRPTHISSTAQSVDETDASGKATTVSLTAEVKDPDGVDTLTYQWVQVAGPAVTLTNATSLTASFVAPDVTADQSLGFELTATDRDQNTKATTEVTVKYKAAVVLPPEAQPGKKSSGSISPLWLLALLGAAGRLRPARQQQRNSVMSTTTQNSLKTKVSVLASALAAAIALPAQSSEQSTAADISPVVAEQLAKSPLSFEKNQGQMDEEVKFLLRGKGYQLFLAEQETVLSLHDPKQKNGAVLRSSLVGAAKTSAIVGENIKTAKSNYFIGKDKKQWQQQVPNYAQVRYNEVYPGIDLVYYGKQNMLEYDFVLDPNIDYKQIQMLYKGAEQAKVDTDGALVLTLGDKEVRLQAPIVYQELAGNKHMVKSSYTLAKNNQGWLVGFELDNYDQSKQLVIDPILDYSSYLGGNDYETPGDIEIAANGDIVVTGVTQSANFPSTEGVYDAEVWVGDGDFIMDGFISRFSADGKELIYSTFIGGERGEFFKGLALDSEDNAYITGETCSTEYPLVNPFQFPMADTCSVIISKISNDGSQLLFSTLYSSWSEFMGIFANDIYVDATRKVTIVGGTSSGDLPLKNPLLDTKSPDYTEGFIAKFSAAGNQLLFASYIGGLTGNDEVMSITMDKEEKHYFIAGETRSVDFPVKNAAQAEINRANEEFGNSIAADAFVMKLKADGSDISYSSYFGGNHSEYVAAVDVDDAGNAYIAGMTGSWVEFPYLHSIKTTMDAFGDMYVTKFSPEGEIIYATTLGGDNGGNGDLLPVPEELWDMKADGAGNVYLAGSAMWANFPLVNPPAGMQVSKAADAVVVKLGPVVNNKPTAPAIVWSGRHGGEGFDFARNIAISDEGIWVLGSTESADIPVTEGAFQPALGGSLDLFLLHINQTDPATDSLQFAQAKLDVDSSATFVEVQISRSGNHSGVLTLPWSTVDDTAKAGTDYQQQSGVLQWAANDTEPKYIQINLLAKTAGTQFKLKLEQPTSSLYQVALGGNAELTLKFKAAEQPATAPVTAPPAQGATPPAAAKPDSSSGGTIGWFSLLLLPLCLRRRKV